MAGLITIVLLALVAVVLAAQIELRLEEGDEAMIYCESSALQVEVVDDLTLYLRCYDDTPGVDKRYYLPAVGDSGGRR